MPVTLNPTGTGTQDPTRAEMFVHLDVSREDKHTVIYRKFISNDPMNDFIPEKGKKWKQVSVGLPKALLELARRNPNFQQRMLRENPDGSTKILGEDDGMIIHYEGKYVGDRYMDRGRIVTDEDAEVMMEAGNTLPVFAMWEFCISDVIATDGPQRREGLLLSHEQKAAHEREGMFTAVRDAFASLVPQGVPRTLEEAEAGEAVAKDTVSPELGVKMKAALREAKRGY